MMEDIRHPVGGVSDLRWGLMITPFTGGSTPFSEPAPSTGTESGAALDVAATVEKCQSGLDLSRQHPRPCRSQKCLDSLAWLYFA